MGEITCKLILNNKIPDVRDLSGSEIPKFQNWRGAFQKSTQKVKDGEIDLQNGKTILLT